MRDLPAAKELYLHYNKGVFVVMAVAKNADTNKESVIFHRPDTPSEVWMRPVEEFLDFVLVSGVKIDRFVRVVERDL